MMSNIVKMESYLLRNQLTKLMLIFFLVLMLFGCSNFRQAIGTEKLELDEFSTVTQRRLEIPENFDLKSNIKSQEKFPSQAKSEMFNYFGIKSRKEMDKHDEVFAKNFPLYEITKNIRIIIDEETLLLQKKSMAGIDMLFSEGSLPLIGAVINPEIEQKKFKYLKGK